jgi:hypothetical protein
MCIGPRWFWLCLGLVLGLVGGCRRPEKLSAPEPSAGTQTPDTTFKDAAERLRRAVTAAGCREVLRDLERYFHADAAARQQFQQALAALHQLREQLDLAPEEWEEVESNSFRPLDAHYLLLCLQLHEAAEALGLERLPPLRQAEEALAWTARQLLLRAPRTPLFPPEAVLAQGEAAARERAVVFFLLLQQLDLSGGLVVFPDLPAAEGWFLGVVLSEKGHSDLYLFDARLGRPLPGPEGQPVATLRQVQARPQLLSPFVEQPPAALRRAELHLIYPLTALAPRLRYLQEKVLAEEHVRLAPDLVAALRRWPQELGLRVQLGELAAGPAADPLRADRLFFPPEEGGRDPSRRLLTEHLDDLLALPLIRQQLRSLIEDFEGFPEEAQSRLSRQMPTALEAKYLLRSRQLLLRGRLEEASRPLMQLNSVLREFQTQRPSEEELRRQIADWSRRLRQVYLQRAHLGSAADKLVREFWQQDQYLLALLHPSEEDEDLPQVQRQLPTFLLLRAMAPILEEELLFLLLQCKREEILRLVREQPTSAEAVARAEAWDNVAHLAQEYADKYPLTTSALAARLGPIRAAWQQRDYSLGLAGWQRWYRQVRRSAVARLYQVEALRHLGQEPAARRLGQQLVRDLAALRDSPDLRQTWEECLPLLRSAPLQLQQRYRPALDSLQQELGPEGGLTWLERQARLEAPAANTTPPSPK